MNHMDLHEKGWQKFLKSEIRLAIESGADGIVLDDDTLALTVPTLEAWAMVVIE